ncbi:hypothetical protein PVAND_008337 [Polypedilum vanderplanki]|uniref:Uncharacterized protein n=1 Tax=Polypedilum vanderplanki TaxID=319348 RepID=A0A9J6C9P2_POLVA|nr:hypothetical protein PVAND_008337 [Polypedilum vanderplanki]
MQPWAIVTITIVSGLALFIILFWIKNRNNKKRMQEMENSNATQLAIYAQQQIPQPQQQLNVSYQQNYPNPNNTYPPPYTTQQQHYVPNQQIGFVNPQAGFAPQQSTFVPQQTPFIPSTSNQGLINMRDQQAPYNPSYMASSRVIMTTTNVASAPPPALH